MASKKQLAWRKKFAKMSKAGKFRGKKGSKARTKMVKTSPNVKALHKKKYMIIRFFRDENTPSQVIKRDLTLAQAQKHASDPKTMKKGVWFDGYDEQDETMLGGSSHGIDRPSGGDW